MATTRLMLGDSVVLRVVAPITALNLFPGARVIGQITHQISAHPQAVISGGQILFGVVHPLDQRRCKFVPFHGPPQILEYDHIQLIKLLI